VEAGGVEPPSEKARREENYVRIRLMVFDLHFRAGEGGEGLVRLDLDRRLRTEAFGLPRKMTLTHHRRSPTPDCACGADDTLFSGQSSERTI
jgi:hypothetical protein